ncbi:endonuclease [Clostridium botulinum]|uniref:Endonuclease n=1 Tax=Clostridium botulinum TaxID=1491 RepID=A0A846JUW0_CLOBO|nr:Z1 domain-containing protein [Clostridium botulinum]NFG28703.1 endonuclease [Clostridium botulinum]NFG37187.1 endonuclease [Clostridium botulinum]NFN04529.1 endonuclease [Clostridium botulinum]NFN16224.1 endonuclease [Clostridium botulinum]NFN36769.1 endonuclease [Clostridium botulinum]
MINYILPKYDNYRKWIRDAREHDIQWKDIEYANKGNEKGLNKFLEIQNEINWWELINSIEWKEIVKQEKNSEEMTKEAEFMEGYSMILDKNQDNAVTVPKDRKSAWVLYKNHLLEQGFKEKVVEEIERSSIKILKRLSSNTVNSGPIKGLVIGNVQSGKTSNMAALMAMAADWRWNMFIVLSGTIENLRQQTQTRLLNDLNFPGNLIWRGIEHPAKKTSLGQRTQDLHFEDDSSERYFTVCLKNAGRLRKLIQWLQSDLNKQKQMKILVIDDEADQAGINTADITNNERRTINNLIVNMVSGKNEKSEEINSHYQAMNYIGYTATPYANILNEHGEESLYPKNFVSALGVSKEYFGPQQIFGVDNGDYDGMNIVRIIDHQNLERIKDIHDGVVADIPDSLKNAICWFLCGTASMRLWNYKKPISMLVHSSQKQDHHQYIADSIQMWLNLNNVEDICKRCEEVWNYETNEFTFENFREQYSHYDRTDEEINRYPNFTEIEPELRVLLNKITNIPLGSEDELEYHNGIHICIDNCSKNGVNDEGMYVRLAYPDSKRMPEPAPAFIVIGGATLSRGLTIEGLISTYFLRSVGQADTLMQMGRWFGYRKGYELLPRLWITSKTKQQFEFLSELDQDLRDEIKYMDSVGIKPENYGPKVKNTPKFSFIRITAKNRMQSALPSEMDYTGASMQTYLFYDNKERLTHNINIVASFINSLGKPESRENKNKHAKNNLLWRNIKFTEIHKMLELYKFPDRLKSFNDVKSMCEWIGKVTEEGKLTNWNVIVAGNKNDKYGYWKLEYGKVNIVSRTQKEKLPGLVNIGVLSDPMDIISDIVLDDKDEEFIERINNCKSKEVRILRNGNMSGLDMTPQLIIYRVCGSSKASDKAKNRYDLNLEDDIVGLCINIPGGRRGTNYVETVSIHIKNNIFDDQGDLEGTNEN